MIKLGVFIFGLLGVGTLLLANFIGIGYFLYNWGVINAPIGLAAWTAFILWIKMLAVGFTSLVMTYLLTLLEGKIK